MSRAKNLTDSMIAEVVGIVDGWSGRLTWDLLVDAVEQRTLQRYTRQALHKHSQIKAAFSLRKKHLPASALTGPEPDTYPELKAANQRIARIEAENLRLRSENDALLEQFVLWAYNAHTRGLDHTFLSRPLPSVNRGQTKARLQQMNGGKS
jgi:hypothetical protein